MSIAPTNHAGPPAGAAASAAPETSGEVGALRATGPADTPPTAAEPIASPAEPSTAAGNRPAPQETVTAAPAEVRATEGVRMQRGDPWREYSPETARQPRRPGSQRGRGLHGQLVQQLGYMIVSGDLNDDRPLVPEEIGQRFEVSRTVVRESLRVLEAKGLVSARPNVGTRIRPVGEWNLFDPDIIEWRAYGPGAEEQRRELAELWSGIEPAAARSAAGRLDQQTLDALAAAQAGMAQAVAADDAHAFTAVDSEFHALVLRAAKNRLLGHLGGVIDAALHVSGAPATGCGRFTAASAAAHERLIEVLADGDADAAEWVARAIIAGDAGHDRVLPGQRAQL